MSKYECIVFLGEVSAARPNIQPSVLHDPKYQNEEDQKDLCMLFLMLGMPYLLEPIPKNSTEASSVPNTSDENDMDTSSGNAPDPSDDEEDTTSSHVPNPKDEDTTTSHMPNLSDDSDMDTSGNNGPYKTYDDNDMDTSILTSSVTELYLNLIYSIQGHL